MDSPQNGPSRGSDIQNQTSVSMCASIAKPSEEYDAYDRLLMMVWDSESPSPFDSGLKENYKK